MQEQKEQDWNTLLKNRISKVTATSYADKLHNDEEGISSLIDTLLTSQTDRVTVNAAWILFHLDKSDKTLYVSSSFDKIADFAMLPHLRIRRGLVLSILLDLPMDNSHRTDLLDFCFKGMLNKNESDSTRSMMIKLAAKMCKPYPELVNELAMNLDLLSGILKPSISCARKNALKCLKCPY